MTIAALSSIFVVIASFEACDDEPTTRKMIQAFPSLVDANKFMVARLDRISQMMAMGRAIEILMNEWRERHNDDDTLRGDRWSAAHRQEQERWTALLGYDENVIPEGLHGRAFELKCEEIPFGNSIEKV